MILAEKVLVQLQTYLYEQQFISEDMIRIVLDIIDYGLYRLSIIIGGDNNGGVRIRKAFTNIRMMYRHNMIIVDFNFNFTWSPLQTAPFTV